jgi:hypothetical protein
MCSVFSFELEIINQLVQKNMKNSMKLLTCSIASIFWTVYAYSQHTCRAKVIDAKSNGVELVQVVLLKDSTVFTSQYTDSTGISIFENLPHGNYVCKVVYLGQTISQDLVFQRDTTIQIELMKSKMLQSANINIKKPLYKRKADRLIFQVENSIVSYGNNLYNLLFLTPGVRLTENSVSIIGKGEAVLYVDDQMVQLGGEDLINYLFTVPSEDVARIEVLSNPPAKYSAEGTSGIILILLKTVLKKGYSGDLNSSVTRNTYWSESVGAGLNYNKGRIVFKNRIHISQNANLQTNKIILHLPVSTNLMETKAKTTHAGFSNNTDLTIKLSERSKFIVTSQYQTAKPFIDNTTDIHYLRNVFSDSISKSSGNFSQQFSSMNSGLNFTHIIDTLGKKFSMDYHYFTYETSRNRVMNSRTLLLGGNYVNPANIHAASKQQIFSNSLNLDVELPYTNFTVTIGGKLSTIDNLNSYENTNVNNGFKALDEKDKFQYTENIQALYASITKKIKKWEFQLGLRGENAIIKSHSLTYNQQSNYNYFKIFPTFYAYRELQAEVYVGGSYSQRIDRPDYALLNPFRFYVNANSYSIGNPFLRPSYADNFELFYYFKDKYSVIFDYSHNTNGFNQVPIIDVANNKQIYTNINYLTQDYYGLNINYSVTKSWLQSDAGLSLMYSHSSSNKTFTYTKFSGFGSAITSSNQIKLPIKGLSMTLYGALNLPSVNEMTKMEAYYFVNTGVMYRTKNRKFIVGLTVNDIFRSMLPLAHTYSNGVVIDIKNYNDNRFAKFSLTYHFGNNKIQVEDHAVKNSEEVNRTKEH